MDNIISKLFNLHLTTDDFPLGCPNKENMDREWKIYNFLYESLPDKHKKAFLEYTDLCRCRQNEEIKNSYEQGIKTGIALIIESLKE